MVYRAIDQRGQTYDLAIAAGDRLRLFRRTWGAVDGKERQIGNNGDVSILARQWARVRTERQTPTSSGGVRGRPRMAASRDVRVAARWPTGDATGRLLLGFRPRPDDRRRTGHHLGRAHQRAAARHRRGSPASPAMSPKAAAAARPGRSSPKARSTRRSGTARRLGDITPITTDDLWARAAEDMSKKPYKALGIDLLNAARQDRERAIDTFIKINHALETAQLEDPIFGVKAFEQLRAAAVNEQLARHLPALDAAIAENGHILGETMRAQEVSAHLRALRAEAARAKNQLDAAEPAPSSSPGPGPR